MVNNQTHCVIVKVIADYDYIYNVIGYDYITSGNVYYNYLKSCNRLQPVTPILLPMQTSIGALNLEVMPVRSCVRFS